MGQAGLCPARSGPPDPPEREWKNLGVGTDARMEGEQEPRPKTKPRRKTAAGRVKPHYFLMRLRRSSRVRPNSGSFFRSAMILL